MFSMKQSVQIQADRQLLLQLPAEIEPGEHEVVVVLEPFAAHPAAVEIDPMAFAGTVAWPIEGLAYQQHCRAEWSE